MKLTLSQLFTSSWSFYKQHGPTIFTTALVFAVAVAGLTTVAQKQTEDVVLDQLITIIDPQFNKQRLNELSRLASRGDLAAITEIETALEGLEDALENYQDPERIVEAVAPYAAVMIGFIMLFILITYLSLITYLALAVGQADEFITALAVAGKKFFPMLGVGIWSLLRSFTWIPLIGPIFGLVLLPRMFAAGVILLKEDTGIIKSVTLSLERTRGYWFKIVGYFLALSALMCGLSLVINLLFANLEVLPLFITAAAAGLLQQLIMAYAVVFTAQFGMGFKN